jgi:hypothetical protein
MAQKCNNQGSQKRFSHTIKILLAKHASRKFHDVDFQPYDFLRLDKPWQDAGHLEVQPPLELPAHMTWQAPTRQFFIA